jgi:hypothetical protein
MNTLEKSAITTPHKVFSQLFYPYFLTNTLSIPHIGPDFLDLISYYEAVTKSLCHKSILQGGKMEQYESNQANTYRIRITETLDRHFTDWLGNLTIIPQENGETLLVGSFSDQPALRGFLDQLWNLNITVITVERIENES